MAYDLMKGTVCGRNWARSDGWLAERAVNNATKNVSMGLISGLAIGAGLVLIFSSRSAPAHTRALVPDVIPPSRKVRTIQHTKVLPSESMRQVVFEKRK